MATPVPKARQVLIQLAADVALKNGVNVHDRSALHTLLKQVATMLGGRPLAHLQRVKRDGTTPFNRLCLAVIKEYEAIRLMKYDAEILYPTICPHCGMRMIASPEGYFCERCGHPLPADPPDDPEDDPD